MRNGLAGVPKGQGEMVAAAISTILAQPTGPLVRAQVETIALMLEPQLPVVAMMLRDSMEEITAFADFPEAYWRKVWSTNPLVISSPPVTVLDVQHGPGSGCDRRGGRGYLRSVHDRDWPEVRCSYRRWPRPGRGLSRGRCSVTTTRRSPRSRATCRI
jgi:hypothetical protein